MDKFAVDYSLYLVTDSTPAILGSRNLADIVEAAIRGGVTIVQYRDKALPRNEQIRVARGLHAVTSQYGVPLLINDSVDIAAEVGCEGAHVGQDDMNILEARKILGPEKILGVSAGTVQEAVTAAKNGADYIGIGAIFATPTKTDTKAILGPWGLKSILAAVEGYPNVRTVCIGGLNASNIQPVIYQSEASRPVDGIAVVSAIIAAQDPEAEARKLLQMIKSEPPFKVPMANTQESPEAGIGELMMSSLKAVRDRAPLSHNMTNLVVQNFAANVALAIGASPIMSSYGEEASDLAKLGGALVLNMGTVTPVLLTNYMQALQAYNLAGRPVVFDPVGVGATAARREAAMKLLSSGYITILKGNESEIRALESLTSPSSAMTGTQPEQKGVDSSATLSPKEKVELVSTLARRFRNVVILTGKEDFLSDGRRTISVRNGHPAMSLITGTGCALGTVISAFAAASGGADLLVSCLCAVVYFTLAGEMAAKLSQGPGTFGPAFVDQLFLLKTRTEFGNQWWEGNAMVRNWTSSEQTAQDLQNFDARWAHEFANGTWHLP